FSRARDIPKETRSPPPERDTKSAHHHDNTDLSRQPCQGFDRLPAPRVPVEFGALHDGTGRATPRTTMKTAPKPQDAETKKWLTTLVERAKALDAIFACGGEVEVAAPLSLRGPGGKKLEIVERIGFRRSNVDKKLRAWCAPASFGEGTETRTDARVREGRQLYARNGALAVEGLDDALHDILRQIRESLCPHETVPPIAELHSLNVYGRGGHFVAHKDTPREPRVFGTLVVCLPLAFSGGRLIVEQQARATFDWETRSYSFDSSPEKEARRIRWAAFFGDVDHRIETVTSGCRATLTYELRRAPDSQAAVPRAPIRLKAVSSRSLGARGSTGGGRS
ncbi:MAG: hypothetical protein KF729_28695, partial [Sandaracinaceae bacterium]|nr:hypothetical protein [Sandaracinaceae bacterium]